MRGIWKIKMLIKDFKPLDIKDISKFRNCIDGRYNNSESSIASMFIWQHYDGAKFTVSDDVIYSLFVDKNNNYSSFMPYGERRNTTDVVDNLVKLYSNISDEFTLCLCTKDFVEFLSSTNRYNFEIVEKRNSFDYVYNTDDLINLPGKKYHGKKNHINTFNKLYSYDYISYDH